MRTSPVTFQPSNSYAEALARATDAWGVERDYWDIFGKHHVADQSVLVAILSSLGVDAASTESLDRALEERLWTEWSSLAPPVLVLSESEPAAIHISIPVHLIPARIQVELVYEDGSSGRVDLDQCSEGDEAQLRGQSFLRVLTALPQPLPRGYHHASVRVDAEGGSATAMTRLIVCPDRAFETPRLEKGGRAAGISVSLYGLRSRSDWGCGDFTVLKDFAAWAGEATGIAFIGINPLHAIANRAPFNTSPYLPDCSFYRNFIYLDIEAMEDFAQSAPAQRLLPSAPVQQELAALRATETVEYERVSQIKLRFLKLIFREFWRDYRAGHPRTQGFREYVETEGLLLYRFAVHCALNEAIHRRHPDVWNWRSWPARFHDPASAAIADFASRHHRAILFYQYVQWQIDRQLSGAQRYITGLGLEIGIYHDLALATDRFGADVWAQRSFYATGCRVGAPPDGFSPRGQDWGFPPPVSERHYRDGYRLFSESIRKSCQHGGALRIDHVMRFFRLYWIPDGMEPAAGTYVGDRYRDLIRILALESVRNRVLIVGEDLGTVPDFVRETLSHFGISSYRLLFFEQDEQGRFRGPDEYPRQALVSASTSDLPTLAGFWLNRDIDCRRDAGFLADEAMYARLLTERGREKQKLLDLLHAHGFLPPNAAKHARHIPELTGEMHNAVLGFLASTPCELMLISQEDLFKETEQQNLPGSTSEYPNWRRKMRYTVDELKQPPAGDYAFMLRQWLERTERSTRPASAVT